MPEAMQLKDQLRSYFNGVGFERWSAIYGTTPDLSRVRQSIRNGHQAMLDQALRWLDERYPDGGAGLRALDAGCGTGLFSLELARRGFQVTSVDIAPQMVAATRQTLEQAGLGERAYYIVSDLEQIDGRFDLVNCFDVLIHYPQAGFQSLCTHLAKVCSGTLLLTYAPYNALLAAMHYVGGFFPRHNRRTEIQMTREHCVDQALNNGSMVAQRRMPVSCGFYHVVLLEAQHHS